MPQDVSGDTLEENFELDGDFAGGSEEDEGVEKAVGEPGKSAKRKKSLQNLREKKRIKGNAITREESASIAHQSASQQAAFFCSLLKNSDFGAKLSSIEVNDCFKDNNFLALPVKQRNVEGAVDHMQRTHPESLEGRREEVSCASPAMAIVVPSSDRGSLVLSALKGAVVEEKVVKAFSSHPKVKKLLAKFLISDKALGCSVIVTTTSRLLKLIKNGEISAERMKIVVIDTFQDSKFRSCART
ncbi:hypothetical protein GUITHDRAFT_149016 [Guillardia theta CCMP2712]|uniref:Uncharacterized protein n=1 Tax=Guillardia theta (strain CCMP2712) TaxID=905079 RepID=L1I7K9_GUITC|nr:hypothetical protein GUITHDRAFT_149016 [Guillardia theta CCMP2712]EKX31869.1 hypothetical protein GUITHDRAFT_149016 [Guillardia theta CCMP2712]|eukprot:XP_005818849.1 hypothetical protein GUITHDRAFT_149016 [Guillardia theta CCMP2712]